MWTKLPAGACSCRRGGLPGSAPQRWASWGRRQQEQAVSEWGILLANLRAATAAPHGQILLLPKGVKLEDGQGEQSPCHEGPVLSFPGAPSAPKGVPALALRLPLRCVCSAAALAFCGVGRRMGWRRRKEKMPWCSQGTFHFPCICRYVISVGPQDSWRGSRAGCFRHRQDQHHLHFIDDR